MSDHIDRLREYLASEAMFPDPADWGGKLAEARDALDALSAELSQARREREEAEWQRKIHKAFGEEQFARAKRAEADLAEARREREEAETGLAAVKDRVRDALGTDRVFRSPLQNDDALELVNVVIEAWEEMHRDATAHEDAVAETRELLRAQDDVIREMTLVLDDLLDRAAATNAPQRTHGNHPGAFALYAETRLKDLVGKVAELSSAADTKGGDLSVDARTVLRLIPHPDRVPQWGTPDWREAARGLYAALSSAADTAPAEEQVELRDAWHPTDRELRRGSPSPGGALSSAADTAPAEAFGPVSDGDPGYHAACTCTVTLRPGKPMEHDTSRCPIHRASPSPGGEPDSDSGDIPIVPDDEKCPTCGKYLAFDDGLYYCDHLDAERERRCPDMLKRYRPADTEGGGRAA